MSHAPVSGIALPLPPPPPPPPPVASVAAAVPASSSSSSTSSASSSSTTMAARENPNDANLTKQIRKMMNRIERLVNPANSLCHNDIGQKLDRLMHSIAAGTYYRDADLLCRPSSAIAAAASVTASTAAASVAVGSSSTATGATATATAQATASHGRRGGQSKTAPTLEATFADRIVDWARLEPAIVAVLARGDPNYVVPAKIQDEIDTEKMLQIEMLEKLRAKDRLKYLQDRNGLAMMPGKWRKEAFAPRKYVELKEYQVADAIAPSQHAEVLRELDTPLEGFLGQAYNYDDHGLTEEWMLTFRDERFSASDDDVIRTQLESLMEIMVVQVQDRVCTELGVLRKPPVGLGPVLKEVPVWGIDSATRRSIELSIWDRVLKPSHPPLSKLQEVERISQNTSIRTFIERRLLPAINAQDERVAHNMSHSLRAIVSDPTSSAQDVSFAEAVLAAIRDFGIDMFRIHPKGTGVICTAPEGIPPHVVITDYLGEMYTPARWCEKLDVVEQAQKQFGLKPTLPDFYNILLERPRQDPNGYGVLYVDASRKANMGSSCSHSCNANCTSAVVARNGKLVIVLTTNRYVYPGEELTMDYYSITTSEIEWRAAICLCGMSTCRGSFLHFATQDDLQQVLNQNCGPLWRFAALLRACSTQSRRGLPKDDRAVLDRHGLKSSVFGASPPYWLEKYFAENIKFVEFERKALPCALLRRRDEVFGPAASDSDASAANSASSSSSTSSARYAMADLDARSVMEQRIQSMVCCISMMNAVMKSQPEDIKVDMAAPLVLLDSQSAAARIWKEVLLPLPDLFEAHFAEYAATSSSSALPAEKKRKIDPSIDAANPVAPPGAPSAAASAVVAQKEKDQTECKAEAKNGDSEGEAEWQEDYFVPMATEIEPSKDEEEQKQTDEKERKGVEEEEETASVELSRARTDESSPTTSQETVSVASQTSSRLKVVVSEIREMLREEPASLSAIRRLCLAIRALIIPLEDMSHSQARLALLADLLVLWAFTSNFSTPRAYATVLSDPITVFARELGTNIPRAKINKPSSESLHGGASSAAHTSTLSRKRASQSIASKSPAKSPVKPTGQQPAEDLIAASGRGINLEASLESEMDDAQKVGSAASNDLPSVKAEDDASITSSASSSSSSSSAAPSSSDKKAPASALMHPDETVYEGSKVYSSDFMFNQLMAWFNAGTDEKSDVPNLFGCVLLPRLAACFGPAEAAYGPKQREAFYKVIRDEKSQAQPWPAALRACFNETSTSSSAPALYGSPLLDIGLGQVDVALQILQELAQSPWAAGLLPRGGAALLQVTKAGDNSQFDNILPPEAPTAWVQCDACRKWRRVPWNIDSESFGDYWTCEMISWDPERASCEAPQDTYNPEQESTLTYNGQMVEGGVVAAAGGGLSAPKNSQPLSVGGWQDVFCVKNHIYYEAQVKSFKTNAQGKRLAKFHFKGWAARFDEWIEEDSFRIQPHNLYTNPGSSNLRQQELWQGVNTGIHTVQASPAKGSPGQGAKRKAGGVGAGAAGKTAAGKATAGTKAKRARKATSTPSKKRPAATATASQSSTSSPSQFAPDYFHSHITATIPPDDDDDDEMILFEDLDAI